MDLQTWVLYSHHLHAGAAFFCTHSGKMHTQKAFSWTVFNDVSGFFNMEKASFTVCSHIGEYRLPRQGDNHKFQQERPQHDCKD